MENAATAQPTTESTSAQLSLAQRFRGFLPVVIDVETGGFDCKTNALLEIAAVPIDIDEDGMLIPGTTVSAHVQPAEGTIVDPKSLEVTKIKLDHPLRRAVTEKEALDKVFAHIRIYMKKHECKRAILVGHNAVFDLNFVNAAVERTQHKRSPFHPFSVFDTVTLGGALFGQTVLARIAIANGMEWDGHNAHSAIYDTEQTAQIFCDALNYIAKGVGRNNELPPYITPGMDTDPNQHGNN